MREEVSRTVYVQVATPRANGLGIAGFVISLLGVLSGCIGGVILCPFGMLLSAFGMCRAPRGLAIAGFVLGILGSLWLVVVGGAVGAGVMSGALDARRRAALEVYTTMDIAAFHKQHGRVPISLTELRAAPGSHSNYTDAQVRYTRVSDHECKVRFAGKDERFGTGDDYEKSVALEGAASTNQPDHDDVPEPAPPAKPQSP